MRAAVAKVRARRDHLASRGDDVFDDGEPHPGDVATFGELVCGILLALGLPVGPGAGLFIK